MKRLFTVVVCVVLACAVSSVTMAARRQLLLNGARSGGSVTYLVKEGFEGTGYETTTPNAWLESGNVNEDDTTFVSEGAQSGSVQRIGTTSTSTLYWKDLGGGTNLLELGGFFSLAITRSNANYSIFNLQTNGTLKNFIQLRSTSQLRLYSSNTAANGTTAEGVGTNTLIYVWWYLNNATGVGNIEWATTPVRVGSGTKYASFSGGETGMALNQIALIADATLCTNYFDYLRVHTNALSSNPQ